MKSLCLFLVVIPLMGCANFAKNIPHGKVSVGGFGLEVSIDTRPLTDMAAGALGGTLTGAAAAAAATPASTAQ